MNKLAVFLIASALISPAFAMAAKTPVKQQAAHKVVMKKHHRAKKAKAAAKKPGVAQSSVSSLRDPNSPWVLPG